MAFEHFKARQGQQFVLHLDDGSQVPTQLLEVRPLKAPAPAERTAFSLLFKGPAAPLLPQRIYRLSQAADSEALDVFIVPVSADATAVHYEAVFS
jgi:hypothetical protein